jgi:hypothetical protein
LDQQIERSSGKISAADTAHEEGVTGDHLTVGEETDAAGGVPGSVEDLEVPTSELD